MCSEEKIPIGKITAAQGMCGEVRLFHDSGDEEALRRLSSLFLTGASGEKEYRIEWLRMQKRTPIIKLSGVEDRDTAESLIGAGVYALLSESRPDDEDAWLVSDLVGLKVFSPGADGSALGSVKSVIDNPAHDVLEIETEGGIRLLPFIDAFVIDVDTEKGIIIAPPAGWAEI